MKGVQKPVKNCSLISPDGAIETYIIFSTMFTGKHIRNLIYFWLIKGSSMTNINLSSIHSYLDAFSGNNFIAQMLNNLYEGAIITNKQGKILFCNTTAEKITGYCREELLQLSVNNEGLKLFSKEGRGMENCKYPTIASIKTNESICTKGLILHKNGIQVPVLMTGIPFKVQDNIEGCMLLLLDDSLQADLDKAHEQLKESSIKDSLTNVYTRTELIERIKIEIDKAHRYQVPLCFCICDVDNFKQINMEFGNFAGDSVLRTIGQLMNQKLRRTDVIGRFGGQQFAIMLPLIDLKRAETAIKKLRKELEKHEIEHITPAKVSMSYGLTKIAPNDTYEDIIERAENALFKAKKLGSDKTEVFA